MTQIEIVNPDSPELSNCFPIMQQLRPHLTAADFVVQVKRLSSTTGYQIAVLRDQGNIKCLAGFRISEWLHTGKYMEIEELVTTEEGRSQGYGKKLFDWCRDFANQQGCVQLRLVSGVARENAHRFYLNQGMNFEAKYFSLDLT